MGTGRRKFAQNAALVLQSGQEGSPRPLQPYFKGDEKQIEGRGNSGFLENFIQEKKLSVIYHTVELAFDNTISYIFKGRHCRSECIMSENDRRRHSTRKHTS